jgi:hypothetical protein
MIKKKHVTTIGAMLFLIQLSLFAQVKFDHDKFSNAKRKHKSMVDVKSENMLRYNVKKLQIIECTGEFELNDAFNSSAFNGVNDFSAYYKKKHGEKLGSDIGATYPETVVNAVYKMHQKIFFENGLKTVDKQKISSNPIYVSEGLHRDRSEKYNGSTLNCKENVMLVSSSGMQQLADNLGYDEKELFYQKLAAIANDTESQAELKIHFKVHIDDDGNPVLTEYKVSMDTWLSAFKKGKETVYKWKIIDNPLFELKKEIKGDAMLMDGSGKIDMDAFDTELMNMLKDITEMFSYALSDQFIKYQ